ncbi:MAG: uncharacterized protein JWO04_837 [Gammaproteobacteria bacterium]|nr:uncharacterized protein [Gammaproteobacteria bacterium]
MAVACVSVQVAAADEPTAPVAVFRTDWGIQLGPIMLTPGGFLEFTSIYRKRNETADIGSSFGSIPFPNNNNYYIKEFRETARDTRVSLLAQGPPGYDYKGEGYLETDFVSAGTNSNGNQSNSYTLRIRQAYLGWSRPDLGWAIMAGQAWSLVTPYKNGLTARQEDIPLVDDGQLYVGFNWARQTQFRLVKTFSPAVAVGLSLESPQNALKGTVPAGATGGNPGGPGLNSEANYSTDIAPDVILKLALDPGYGHYELYSLTRFLHDRAPGVPGNLASETSHTTVAQSFGAGLILPLWSKWLELHATTLIGHGNGRYGSAQLSDSTYNARDGSVAALREQQGLVGLIAHPLQAFDVYAYGGFEQQTAAYGLVPDNNMACSTNFINVGSLPTSADCGGVGRVRQVAGGFVWKAYRGPLGYVTAGPEVEYVKDTTYAAKNGTTAETNNIMVYITIRYYP